MTDPNVTQRLFETYAPHLEQFSTVQLIALYVLYVGVIVGILVLVLDRVQRQRRAREQQARIDALREQMRRERQSRRIHSLVKGHLTNQAVGSRQSQGAQ